MVDVRKRPPAVGRLRDHHELRQTRQDFTKNTIDIVDTSASNLTNADMNEDAANSQALSTRQSLGMSALSPANTAPQGILQLLRSAGTGAAKAAPASIPSRA